jgi:hypothetical protein
MSPLRVLHLATSHQLYAASRRRPQRPDSTIERDRGAVSLEQVLWFVAAGVSVAVIAAILWTQIKDRADDPITPPVAP